MSGFDQPIPQPLETPPVHENPELSGSGMLDLWQERLLLPGPQNTAEAHLPDLTLHDFSDLPALSPDSTTPVETSFGPGSIPEQVPPPFEVVTIPGNDGLQLSGLLWKPPGNGPFPAVIYNHGSEPVQKDINYEEIANFYVRNGFEFLLPLRRGHSYLNDNETIAASDGVLFDDRLEEGENGSIPGADWIHEQEIDNEDVVAAAKWLADQPNVDQNKMIMSGISFGGIQTLLAAEKGLDMQAFIPFAPAAMSWNVVPEVQGRLEEAVREAKAPVFLIQAANDYSTTPSQILGPMLDEENSSNRHTVFPAFQAEKGPKGGHSEFALHGMPVWREDVSDFLQENENLSLPRQ